MLDTEKNKIEFLKNEYLQMSELFKTYWNGRLTIMVVCLSLIGLIFKEKFTTTSSTLVEWYDLGIFLIITLMVRILSTISRGIYLFMFRMKDIAQSFGVSDFWTTIPFYFKRNRQDAGTFMFYIVSHATNMIFLILYLIINAGFILSLFSNFSFTLKFVIFIINIGLFIYNFFRTENGLNTHKYFDSKKTCILKGWNSAVVKSNEQINN
jgi:hypothetical protein